MSRKCLEIENPVAGHVGLPLSHTHRFGSILEGEV